MKLRLWFWKTKFRQQVEKAKLEEIKRVVEEHERAATKCPKSEECDRVWEQAIEVTSGIGRRGGHS